MHFLQGVFPRYCCLYFSRLRTRGCFFSLDKATLFLVATSLCGGSVHIFEVLGNVESALQIGGRLLLVQNFVCRGRGYESVPATCSTELQILEYFGLSRNKPFLSYISKINSTSS